MLVLVASLFAAVAELVAFGTFGFFFLLVVAALIIATEVEFDKGTGATFTLVGTVLAVHFLSGLNLLTLLQHHFLWFAVGAVLYVVVGGLWSLAKIGIVAGRIDSKYRRLRDDFCATWNITNGAKIAEQNEKTRSLWESTLNNNNIDIDQNNGTPTFNHRKRWRTVYMWIGHWPFSMLGTLCNDVVRHAIDYVYARLDSTYAKIVKSVLGKNAGDILTYEQKKAALATAAAAAEATKVNQPDNWRDNRRGY